MKIGRAAAVVLQERGKSRPKILIGQGSENFFPDARSDADRGRYMLGGSRCAQNRHRAYLAVAYLVKKNTRPNAGVMISAS